MDESLAIEAVLVRAGWINKVLIAGVLLSATVCLIHYRKGSEFEILDIKLPLRLFPIFCIGYTIAHMYCTVLFTSLCIQISQLPTVSPKVVEALTLKGPLMFNGMSERQVIRSIEIGGDNIPVLTRIDFFDPTLWLFYSFCAIVYLGFVYSCQLAQLRKRTAYTMAIILLSANWLMGSIWANAASMLY